MSTQISLVSVEKDGDLRTHVGKRGIVAWSNGKETFETLPACGTKVDVTALLVTTGTTPEVTCRRCERTSLYAQAAR